MWSRGVDLARFRPDIAPPGLFFALPRPIQLYVGRVAPEKNIEAFLANEHPGTKVVVGDGPALPRLQAEYPDARFLGRQTGEALAACYAGADVFVFPSRTDTFGLVMMAPGDPFVGEKAPPLAVRQALAKSYGLDYLTLPAAERKNLSAGQRAAYVGRAYCSYLSQAVWFDFGPTIDYPN